ncbi:MAG: hypothetical protein WCF84_15300, partial [Anaerolineae bacterium]
ATRTTDDYGTRLWADLSPVRSRWVLVTLLFDGSPDPGDSRPLGLYRALHAAVARYLEGVTP